MRVRALSKHLARFPGVVGVFWGHRKRVGAWTNEHCICVHVREKRSMRRLPSSERLPRKIENYHVDVLEVGAPRAHALDQNGMLDCPGAVRRTSSPTALANDGADAYALVSGHGVLPFVGGRILSSYRADGPGARISLGGVEGEVQTGKFGGSVDWALVRFDGRGGQANNYSWTADNSAPLRLRRTPLSAGEPVALRSVAHPSPSRAQNLGKFRQVSSAPVTMLLSDGESQSYDDVLLVDGDDPGEPFSQGGDSGALVVDQSGARLVVGMLLGGVESGSVSYVLDLSHLANHPGARFDLFFR